MVAIAQTCTISFQLPDSIIISTGTRYAYVNGITIVVCAIGIIVRVS